MSFSRTESKRIGQNQTFKKQCTVDTTPTARKGRKRQNNIPLLKRGCRETAFCGLYWRLVLPLHSFLDCDFFPILFDTYSFSVGEKLIARRGMCSIRGNELLAASVS